MSNLRGLDYTDREDLCLALDYEECDDECEQPCPLDRNLREAAIKMLRKDAVEIERRSWISVDDALPSTTQIVIAAFEDGDVLPVFYRHPNEYMANGFRWIASETEAKAATHWMPLPDAPLPTKDSDE